MGAHTKPKCEDTVSVDPRDNSPAARLLVAAGLVLRRGDRQTSTKAKYTKHFDDLRDGEADAVA